MNNLETNAGDVYRRFEDLSYKEMRKSLMSGLRRTLSVVKNHAVKNFKASVNGSSRLYKAIRTTRVREYEDGNIVGYVSMDTDRGKYRDYYPIRMLEIGSSPGHKSSIARGTVKNGIRYAKTYNGKILKKPKSAGHLKSLHFFKDTIETKDQYFQSTMKAAIEKAVDKINQTL